MSYIVKRPAESPARSRFETLGCLTLTTRTRHRKKHIANHRVWKSLARVILPPSSPTKCARAFATATCGFPSVLTMSGSSIPASCTSLSVLWWRTTRLSGCTAAESLQRVAQSRPVRPLVGCGSHIAARALDQILGSLVLKYSRTVSTGVERPQRPAIAYAVLHPHPRCSVSPPLGNATATAAMRTNSGCYAPGIAARAGDRCARRIPFSGWEVFSAICRRTASAAFRARESKSLIVHPLTAIDVRLPRAPGSGGF